MWWLLTPQYLRKKRKKNVKKAAEKAAAKNAEKTTLGDIDALVGLKEKMTGKK